MPAPRRWRSLNELRDAYKASGLALTQTRQPGCRGKIRHGTPDDAARHVETAAGDRDRRRNASLAVYQCRYCGGYHVGHHRGLWWPRRHGRNRRKGSTH